MGGDEATSAFAGDPQPVEVYHRGIWYLGELLGWRHEGEGRCLARVRCVVDGLRHSAWKDLGDLRLPQPIAREPDPDAEPETDETRPHVLLADLRTRPRPPAHAIVPPPRWTQPEAPQPVAPQPASARLAPVAVGAADENDAPDADSAPDAEVAPPARRHDTADWAHLRRGAASVASERATRAHAS